MMNDFPDRELTPTELKQLIESNARAIQANSAANVELRTVMYEGFAAVQRDLQNLARLTENLFQGQGGTNVIFHDALEGHETRIQQLEQQGSDQFSQPR
jgi:hypothetical protein